MAQTTIEASINANWRGVFATTEQIQRVRPREYRGQLLNPHVGTTTFQRFNGDPLYEGNRWSDREGPEQFPPYPLDGNLHNDRYPDTTLSYCRWIWSRFEPEKGKFRWDFIDGALETAAARGQTVQMRMQPYIGDDMPAWYWDTGAGAIPTQHKHRTREPDHNDERFLRHWGDVIRAFGDRYDGHPGLESFDIAYGGACGEMGGNATFETAAKLVDVYVGAFKRTTLVSMQGTHGCLYATTLPSGQRIGWRGDCIGDLRAKGAGIVPDELAWNHSFDAYPRELFQYGTADTWKTAPVTLETCWTVGHWYEQGWDIDWLLEQIPKYHPSVFMPKSCYWPEAWRAKLDAFNSRLGYRIVLRQMKLPLEARAGQHIELDVWVDNVGMAPIYRPYAFALRFRQPDRTAVVPLTADLRTWLPDYTWFKEAVRVPASLAKGVAAVDCAIVNPQTQKPVAKLAIDRVLADGWHPLTHIDVV